MAAASAGSPLSTHFSGPCRERTNLVRRPRSSGGFRSKLCSPATKVNLDIFWLKDHALDDPDLLLTPDEAAAETVESLETAFEVSAKAPGKKLA